MKLNLLFSSVAPAVLFMAAEASAFFGFGGGQSDADAEISSARATAVELIKNNVAADDFVPPAAGVGREDATRFAAARAAGRFACRSSSPVVSVSWEMVNDDFCDCNDGSDEPGTSACSNGECVSCRLS